MTNVTANYATISAIVNCHPAAIANGMADFSEVDKALGEAGVTEAGYGASWVYGEIPEGVAAAVGVRIRYTDGLAGLRLVAE